jgi:hypothetical protein
LPCEQFQTTRRLVWHEPHAYLSIEGAGMRGAVAIILACACARGAPAPAASIEQQDAGDPDGSAPVVLTDAGSDPIGDAGSPDVGNAGDAGPSDGGSANPIDAGTPDSGMTTFSPVVGSDGGTISLVINPESNSSCAQWLPQPADPESRIVRTDPWSWLWTEPISNGRGDFGVELDGTFWDVAFLSDTGTAYAGTGGWIVPQEDTFLFLQISQPCMMCWPNLTSRGGGSVFLGTGYPSSTNCTYAARQGGDGAFVSCVPPPSDGGVSNTFSQYDEWLTLVSRQPGDGLTLIAADAQDRLIEADPSQNWRWIDSSGRPLTDFFPGAASLQPLIGGGFVDHGGRIVPSGGTPSTHAPSWLTRRSSVFIVLGGRAYALGDNDCGLEIRNADGNLCGTLEFANCRTPPRPGFDGSIALPMLVGEYITEQTLAIWPRLLH